MAIEEVLHALDTEADQQCEQIRQAAEAEAASMKADARARAEETRRRMTMETEARARTRASRIVNEARAEQRRLLARLREEAVDTTFDKALPSLSAAREHPRYADLFRELACEAMRGVRRPAQLQVDPVDEALARRIAGEFGEGVTVEAVLSSAGGVVACCGDGRVRQRNTVEDRLEKARRVLRSEVAEMLFQ